MYKQPERSKSYLKILQHRLHEYIEKVIGPTFTTESVDGTTGEHSTSWAEVQPSNELEKTLNDDR